MSTRTQGFMIGVAVGIALHYVYTTQRPVMATAG